MSVSTNGDPFPSDIGDVKPRNLADSYREHDYDPSSIESKKIPVIPPVRESDQTKAEYEVPVGRQIFAGILVKRLDMNTFTILRQDGKYGLAYTKGDTRPGYESLVIGDMVALITGELPDTYWIVGSYRNVELSFVHMYNSSIIQIDTHKDLMITPRLITGFDLVVEGQKVRVKHDEYALYEISITATVENIEVNNKNVVSLHANCELSPGDNIKDLTTFHGINFDRNVGLHVSQTADSCDALVSINVPESYYVPQTNEAEETIWSDGLILGSYIEVGKDTKQGAVKIANKGGDDWWLVTGSTKSYWRAPNKQAEAGGHLIADLVAGEKVQLSWTQPGAQGTIDASSVVQTAATAPFTLEIPVNLVGYCVDDVCYYSGTITYTGVINYTGTTITNRSWTIDEGLVVSGPNTQLKERSGVPSIDIKPRKIWTCDDD